MQTQAKWISPPFSCWKCPLFVLLFFFYKKELTGLHFSVTDRKYSSISLKLQKYFFTQFSDFPNYWPRPGWPATAKKENLSNFAKKCFVGQAYATGRDSFISYVTYSPAAAIIRWINWKCLSIKRESFEKILKFLTVVYVEGEGG